MKISTLIIGSKTISKVNNLHGLPLDQLDGQQLGQHVELGGRGGQSEQCGGQKVRCVGR